jgi:hypothetical protein
MIYGCLCAVCKWRHAGTLETAARPLRGLGQGRRYPASQKRPIESAIRHVPEPEIRLPERDSVPNGAVVAVSVCRHRFSKISRLSITLTSGHGIEGDAHYGPFMRHRYLARRIQRRPTSGRSTSSRANYSMRSRLPDSKCAPGDLGENIATVGLDLECLPWARCSGLAPRRCSNLPASARPASSSIASSAD